MKGTTPQEAEQFQRLLGDGAQFGITITYTVQASADGLAQAFLLGADHVAGEPSCLILDDNIFYGPGLGHQLSRFTNLTGAAVFGYRVPTTSSPHAPSRYASPATASTCWDCCRTAISAHHAARDALEVA